MKMTTTLKLGAGTAALGLALAAFPAYAQDADTDAAEAEVGGNILVTGTRISNPNLQLSSPVTFISEDEINFQQPVSIEELLRNLPSTTPSIGAQTNNGSNGSARVNLRGLGTNRNLVLLNGRRVTPRDTDAVVDLNVIPIALIERADVLTGGAATVYGADAVAGVVNFITRRDFSGFDVRLVNGISERGDGQNFRADLTMGANFDDGRGNAVLSVNYTKTKPVLQGDRRIGEESRSSSCTAGQVSSGACDTLAFGNPQGSVVAAPSTILFPFTGRVSEDGNSFLADRTNNYNFNPLNLYQSPLERYSIYGQARYEVASNIEAYAEAMYVKSIVEINLAPAGIFGSSVDVPLNSPFLSDQQRNFLCTSASNVAGSGIPAGADCAAEIAAGSLVTTAVGRRFTEAGPRVSKFETDMFHLTGGFRGKLTDTLNWDVHGSYGRSNASQTRTGWGLLSRARSAVAGCPTGSAPGCVPLNLFGPEGSITPEMLAYIDLPTRSFNDTTFLDVSGVIDGDLGFSSPFAETPVGIAFGAEYRRYQAGSEGDAISQIPGEVLGAGAAALPIRGEFNSKEVFLEVVAPLVEDKPFFYNLTLEGGVRYADYSTTGGAWTWKVGGSWSPIPEAKLRGVYARAIRAPNIAELFQPQVTALTGRSTDPCQGSLADIAARGANFQALCTAQLQLVGAPTSLLGTIAPPNAGQIQSTQGGNPNLDPEKARTITAGIVVTPNILSSFSASFDYFNIKVTDAITTPSQGDIIDGCFQANPVPGTCGNIFRNPLTGSLSGPPDTTFGPVLALSNLGTIKTNGFDLAVNAAQDFDFGRISLGLNATWTQDFLFQATPLSINRQCVGYYSINCGVPQPKFFSNTRLTYSTPSGNTDLTLLWRHISSTEAEPVAPNPQLPVGTPTTAGPINIVGAYRNVPSYDWFDLALRQKVLSNMVATLTVTNLFDKDPPDLGNTIGTSSTNSGNTFPTLYDPIGRRFVFGLQMTF